MAHHTPPSPTRPTRALVFVATVVGGLLWVTVKHPLEGPTIYEFGDEHGIHLLDLLAVIPPMFAWWWMQTVPRR